MSKNHGFGKFLLGACVGAGIALLFAPASGKETRKLLKERIIYLKKKLDEIEPDDVKDKALDILDSIKTNIEELDKERVREIFEEKSLMIIAKADELYTLAKEKGTPIFEKNARDIKYKTSVVLRNMADKLDEKEASNKEEKPVKKVVSKKTITKKSTSTKKVSTPKKKTTTTKKTKASE